jgi:hypothetical protein
MSPVSMRRAQRRARRGQTLVLAALLMLVVVMTVFLTFAIGVRTRRKIQLQAVADSTAYSLAVAEARAFNFYAWSNRALVAHNVSILSVHAHQSYLSFYEDMLAATGRNYNLIADELVKRCASGSVESCKAKDRVRRIANIYLHSYFDPTDVWQPHTCEVVAGKLECRVDTECADEGTCDLDSARKRGADWFHDVWHEKLGSNSCYQLVTGTRDHFEKVEILRAHQLRVEAQLQLMMTGHMKDAYLSSEEKTLLDRSTNPGYYPGKVMREPLVELSLPQALATLADPALTSHDSAGYVSLGYYEQAVDNGLLHNLHKDYDEVLAATRYPAFITRRGFQNDPNWRRLGTAATKAARGTGTPRTTVENEGTARMLKVGGGQVDPGTRNSVDPHDGEWPPTYPGDPTGPAGAVPLGGQRLANAAHRDGHDQFGFGESDGAAAEDHGVVRSSFRLPSGATLRQNTRIVPGRNGVWGDPHDWNGGSPTHSQHIFHSDMAAIPAHGTDIGDCEGPGCNDEMRRGLYRGHMRFRIANIRAPDDLWNMPRTLSLITRPSRDARPGGQKWPWEFRFNADLPGSVEGKMDINTLDAPGDKASGNTMAALAAGLVYFHKPPNSGEEYGEPPNLWNPFWRAKLHPVKQSDAIQATAGVHNATYLLLLDLSRWSAVNY